MGKSQIHRANLGSTWEGNVWETNWICVVAEVSLFFLQRSLAILA